jgi:hypothetical protein
MAVDPPRAAIYTASVEHEGESTLLEWVADSDFRFFPTVRDETFGYILHPVDLAANKVMAAADRREVRDLIDLVTVHETILPLGAVIWAAVEKSPGFTPEGLIAAVRRNSHYPAAEWRAVAASQPIAPAVVMGALRSALDEAGSFVGRMPTDKAGLLFLKGGRVVQPDPDRLGEYQTHAGRRRGHWPTSAGILSAMLERYNKPPNPEEGSLREEESLSHRQLGSGRREWRSAPCWRSHERPAFPGCGCGASRPSYS